jgi:hypothetical protein
LDGLLQGSRWPYLRHHATGRRGRVAQAGVRHRVDGR